METPRTVSRTSQDFWTRQIVFTLLMLGAAAIFIGFTGTRPEQQMWLSPWFYLALLMLALFVAAWVRFAMRDHKRIEVSPTGLRVTWPMTGKTIEATNEQVAAVTQDHLSGGTMGKGSWLSSYEQIEIVLQNGKKIAFTPGQYANYAEVKEAVLALPAGQNLPPRG